MYESKCLICNPASSQEEGTDDDQPAGTVSIPREGIYIGETSRSLHECALEYVKDAQTFSVKSHITQHWMNTHPTLPSPPKMEFSIISRFRDCLSRQIGEALRINFSKDVLLNSKAEYLSNSVNRLTVKEDPWEMKERARKEEEQEEIDKKRVEEFKRAKTADEQIYANTCSDTITEHAVNLATLEGGSSVNTLTGTQCNIVDVDTQEQEDNMASLEGGSSVNTLTGTKCNIVPMNNQEHDCDFDTNLANMEGGGGVNTLTGTECNTVYETDEGEFNQNYETTIYETDEDEFSELIVEHHQKVSVTVPIPATGAPKCRKAGKQNLAPARNRKRCQGYNLGYLNLWWN